MITGELKNKIDRIWLEFWQGGITNPLTVIEQITYLMFIRLLDLEETRLERQAARTKKPHKGHFTGPDDPRRWGALLHSGSQDALKVVRDDVFPHIKEIAGRNSTFGRYMADATFMINKPALLTRAMELINDLPLEKGDVKGDIYEYLLSKLTTAGIAGQFRTPRHIIRMMVELLRPQLSDTIADPACGTAGFLCAVIDYLNETHSSDDGTIIHMHPDGTESRTYLGDRIPAESRAFMREGMFAGMDFDVSMLRIAAMNMMLHGVDNPTLEYMDTLSNAFPEQLPDAAADAYDIILANPPFKGAIDYEQIHRSLSSKLKTRKTELLFPLLMLRMLRLGGRCACIVPEGVLFGSSRAHRDLRRILIEDHKLDAVISMPSGVFKPYSGVSTAVLLFQRTDTGGTGEEFAKSKKAGLNTEAIWFYRMEHDGFTLDDKRTKTDDNDIPDVITRFHARHDEKQTDRTKNHFAVPVEEIREAKYDLSVSRYREIPYEAPDLDPPEVILDQLEKLEAEIAADLKALREAIA